MRAPVTTSSSSSFVCCTHVVDPALFTTHWRNFVLDHQFGSAILIRDLIQTLSLQGVFGDDLSAARSFDQVVQSSDRRKSW